MEFLSTFYGVITNPGETFQELSSDAAPNDVFLAYGFLWVIFLSAAMALYAPFGHALLWTIFKVFFASVAGFLVWVFTSGIFSITSYAFGARPRFRTMMVLTAFSMLPWIFLPVMMLFHGAFGFVGPVLCCIGRFVLWLWSAILFLMALKCTFQLSTPRVLLVACIPMLMMILGLSWVSGIVVGLVQSFS